MSSSKRSYLRGDTAGEAWPVCIISRDANSLHNETIMQLQQELAGAVLSSDAAMELGSACREVHPLQLFSPGFGYLHSAHAMVSCFTHTVNRRQPLSKVYRLHASAQLCVVKQAAMVLLVTHNHGLIPMCGKKNRPHGPASGPGSCFVKGMLIVQSTQC